MGIEIRTTNAEISINKAPSRLEIQSRYAKLEQQSQQPNLNIHTERPTVEIDQYECWASVGLKGPVDLTRDFARRANQQVLEGIARRVSDGNALAAIENGGNVIASIAKNNATTSHEFGIVSLPSVGPKITVRGSIQFDPARSSEGIHNGVEGNYTPSSLNMNFTPEALNISIGQYNSININYLGNNVDKQL